MCLCVCVGGGGGGGGGYVCERENESKYASDVHHLKCLYVAGNMQ